METQNLDPVRNWALPESIYSNRASSLTPSSLSFLSKIGAWSHVDASRVQSYHHMRVWDGLSDSASISFDSPSRDAPIAYMTENPNLTRALLRRLAELPPISVFQKISVGSIRLGPQLSHNPETSSIDLSSYPHLTLSSGHTIAARLLVGADGLNSPVRAFAGIRSRGWDYDRHGVVATVRLASDNEAGTTGSNTATAYQRFLPSGPVALLPLPGDFATLVWSTTPQYAAQIKALSSEDFVAMVNAAFQLEMVDIKYMHTIPEGQVAELEWREGVTGGGSQSRNTLPGRVIAVQPNSVASFPLRFRHADTYISSRIALIGDAAHTIHPLAGQGLNMGLGDVKALLKAIEYHVTHGGDIGVEGNLERYAQNVYVANSRMLGVVDKLHWLYRWEGPLGVGIRSLGLKTVDKLGGLKGLLMMQAGGASPN